MMPREALFGREELSAQPRVLKRRLLAVEYVATPEKSETSMLEPRATPGKGGRRC